MTTGLVLALALLLDAFFGEPDWLWRRFPHPAVLMGRAIGWCDRTFNDPPNQQIKGVAVVLALVFCAGLLGSILALFGPIVEILAAAILLAHRSLVEHVRAVADGLRLSLGHGRQAVSMIVSRDTSDMAEPSVARSAIESAAENLSDGVVAPAFWFLLGGLPGIFIYKVVNTADSMIGYRTPAYAEFGWAAARLDDLLNWIPARVTAFFIALPSAEAPKWGAIKRDAALHRSPNAGWPEAAMARALDVALAGPRAYDGKMQDFAWVNGKGRREIGPVEIDAAIVHMWHTWLILLATSFAVGLLMSL